MPNEDEVERKLSGLCADCINAQKIRSDRGTKFILCRLSTEDPNFPKYPRLPVMNCAGFKPVPS